MPLSCKKFPFSIVKDISCGVCLSLLTLVIYSNVHKNEPVATVLSLRLPPPLPSWLIGQAELVRLSQGFWIGATSSWIMRKYFLSWGWQYFSCHTDWKDRKLVHRERSKLWLTCCDCLVLFGKSPFSHPQSMWFRWGWLLPESSAIRATVVSSGLAIWPRMANQNTLLPGYSD